MKALQLIATVILLPLALIGGRSKDSNKKIVSFKLFRGGKNCE